MVDEISMQSHWKKGTRPLDRLLRHERGEDSKEPKEINFQDNVEWVDALAKESFKSYQKYVMEKYGDNTSKHPLFDLDTWMQACKKKGRFDINDLQVIMTGSYLNLDPNKVQLARVLDIWVQQLNEKIVQLQQEKEAERLEKEKGKYRETHNERTN
ncbi:hypothetical protein R6Q57_019493 [Mikania cordata]